MRMINIVTRLMLLILPFVALLKANPEPGPDPQLPTVLGSGILDVLGLGKKEVEATEENLVDAADKGNLELVKDLIARGVDKDALDGYGLIFAAKNGHFEVVKYLLEAGANPDGPHRSLAGAPLKEAAGNNYLNIIDLLLKSGATVNFNNSHSTEVTHDAAKNGHLEAVQRLLDAGFDPNTNDGYSILLAAQNGHVKIVEAFITAGANMSIRHGWIMTNAAEKGHLPVVEVIYKAGVTQEVLDNGLVSAAGSGHFNVTRFLLQKGANLTDENILADAASSRNIDVVRILLEYGANITNENLGPDTKSPLHNAAKEGSADIIALLVKHGANINAKLTKDTWIDFGENINYYGNGWTVVHVVSRFGFPIIQQLVELGADINIQDAEGSSPLHVAMSFKKLMVAKELLKYCSDVSLTNKKGETALDIAKQEASSPPANTTKVQDLMDFLQRHVPERLATSPFNEQETDSISGHVKALVEANPALKDEVNRTKVTVSDLNQALSHSFTARNLKQMVNVIEDHSCKFDSVEKTRIPVGTEYQASCQCQPGRGPVMTFKKTKDINNVIGSSTEASVVRNSTQSSTTDSATKA